MTRKDYKLIAEAFENDISMYKRARKDKALNSVDTLRESVEIAAVKSLAIGLAQLLQYDNSRFDKSRFLAACGLED
jgi:hypothetical protein